MSSPKFLLVDELSLGLMPRMVDACFGALAALREEGLTILLVEQNTARALGIADHVCILASGKAIYRGTAREAQENKLLFESYLGVSCQATVQ